MCVEFLSAKRWAAAFHTVGLGAVDSRLSQDMAKLFPNGRMRSVPAACLTVAELSRILPKNFPTRLLLWVRAPLQRRRMLTISRTGHGYLCVKIWKNKKPHIVKLTNCRGPQGCPRIRFDYDVPVLSHTNGYSSFL